MMKLWFFPLFFSMALLAEEPCEVDCMDGYEEAHGEFQTQSCEAEPDWSELRDESDWPARRGDPFIDALRGS